MTIRNTDPADWGSLVPDSQGASLSIEVLTETWDLVGELGSEAKAAVQLGISRSGVHHRIQRYRNLIGSTIEVKPRKRRVPTGDITRCSEAWEAWGRYGNGRVAAVELGLDYEAFRSRIKRHREYSNLSSYFEPAGVEEKRIARYTRSWDAWGEHGSQEAAARALGCCLSTVQAHIRAYRRYNKLTHERPDGLKFRPCRPPMAAK